jgi:hypothetical protein
LVTVWTTLNRPATGVAATGVGLGDGVGTAVGTVVGRVVGTTLAAGMSGAVTGEDETAGSGDDVVCGAAAGRCGRIRRHPR